MTKLRLNFSGFFYGTFTTHFNLDKVAATTTSATITTVSCCRPSTPPLLERPVRILRKFRANFFHIFSSLHSSKLPTTRRTFSNLKKYDDRETDTDDGNDDDDVNDVVRKDFLLPFCLSLSWIKNLVFSSSSINSVSISVSKTLH